MSEALADLVARNRIGLGEFRALLALDQLVRSLGEALLVDSRSGAAPVPKPETWPAAHALARSFGQAFELALRPIVDGEAPRGWGEHIPTVLLRLFQHRQLEFLLQPYACEHSLPDGWSGLHSAYRYVESAAALSQTLAVRRSFDGPSEETTLEREYLHVLLLQLLNDGRLSPYEAFWLSRQIPRWCVVLSLQPDAASFASTRIEDRFVVDLESAAGLVRRSQAAPGAHRHLDLAPLLAQIQSEITVLADPSRPVFRSASLPRGRQLRLLRAISALCQPTPAPIRRRGERLPAVASVEAVVGLSRITRILREEERARSAAGPAAPRVLVGQLDRVRDEAAGAAPTDTAANGALRSTATCAESDRPDQVWQIKDRSESGCRFRGRIASSNRVLPGALVAFRERDTLPWTLAVVRRLRKRIGDRVDIGVEFLGQNPVAVGLAPDDEHDGSPQSAPARKRRQCVALYLRESSGHPKLPFRTLILPPRQFLVGRCLTLRSNGHRHKVRLKEPIEEQDGFVWVSYEVVFRPDTLERPLVRSRSLGPPMARPEAS